VLSSAAILGVSLDLELRPVVIIGPDGLAAAANGAMATALHRSRGEFPGLPMGDLFALDSRSGVQRQVDACLFGRDAIFDTVLATKNGFAVPATIHLVNASMGTSKSVAHVLTIITFRQKAEDPVLASGMACTVCADARSFGVITRAWGPALDNQPSPVGQLCCEALCGRHVPCYACPLYSKELGADVATAIVPRRSDGKLQFDVVSVRVIGNAEIAMTRWSIDQKLMSALTAARIGEVSADAKLSVQEAEVLGLLFLGRSTEEIAHQMHIVPRTAKYHQRKVLQKVGAESRFDLCRLLL
jgi:DNA-binding CsgD family transcriptional regulator